MKTLPVFLLATLAQPAFAQKESGIPVPAAAIAHVGDCLDAVKADSVDLSLIEARGWKSMQARSGDGNPLSIAMYSHPEDMSFLLATNAKAKKIQCAVLIPTDGLKRAEDLRDALNAKLSSQASGGITTQATWNASGRHLVLTPMGNAANPSGVKIEVTLEKK